MVRPRNRNDLGALVVVCHYSVLGNVYLPTLGFCCGSLQTLSGPEPLERGLAEDIENFSAPANFFGSKALGGYKFLPFRFHRNSFFSSRDLAFSGGGNTGHKILELLCAALMPDFPTRRFRPMTRELDLATIGEDNTHGNRVLLHL
ncbi:hypothetical protein DVH24_018821 [Malus domestica]|uniref:Uncharacterized protein n=1 Tax=Malus domestica TaxID=3750 RepID=A0A498HJ24_MALDO|nr:hypothetical protein DVH24_018821 [Malus domestica]